MVLDNLGCVAILGGMVPAFKFARGDRVWGEYVSGGSPNPLLQRFALAIHDLQEAGGFTLVPVWRPRTENVRADFLSRVSTLQLYYYRLRPAVFGMLDAAWGPHTIDRLATKDSCQSLQPPHAGRFCALFFHPDAVWTDAFSAPWAGEVNWVFPPFPFVGEAITALRSSGAPGTLIAPESRSEVWWPMLQARSSWAPDIWEVRRLGTAGHVLSHLAVAHGLRRDTTHVPLRRQAGTPHSSSSVSARPVAATSSVAARVSPASLSKGERAPPRCLLRQRVC